MKLTVLVDNNTLIDRYYLGEPGVSYFLEEAGHQFLFDTGYSDIFLANAEKLGLAVTDLSAVLLSHGHNDHSRGLCWLRERLEKTGRTGVPLLAHPDAFLPKREGPLSIGMPLSEETLSGVFALRKERRPVWLTDRLVWLGEIPRQFSFEGKPVGECWKDGVWQTDPVMDDTALAYRSEAGAVVITGCSHAGICSITEYAKSVLGENRVAAIIGGFHLLHAPAAQLEATRACLEASAPGAVYACHCTDLAARIFLAETLPVREVGVSSVLSWD